MLEWIRTIKIILDKCLDTKAIYTVHMNPVVREAAKEIRGDFEKIGIIEPLEALDFHNFMAKSCLILTDSGGIQEKASSLGKSVLAMRNITERSEGIEAGIIRLVGIKKEVVYSTFSLLL